MSEYILHIASWFPNRYNPYNGDFIERHISSLTKRPNVTIHARVSHEIEKEDFEKNHGSNSENWIAYVPINKQILFPLIQYRALKDLVQKVTSEKGAPVLFHIHAMQYASLLIPFLKKEFNLPIVITEHSTLFSSDIPVKNKSIKIGLCQFMSKKADLILPVSNQLKTALSTHGFKNRFSIIHNVVPDFFFSQQRIKHTSKRFLHVSSLKQEHKNIEGILKTFSLFLKNHPDAMLTVVGNDLVETSQKFADTLGISKNNLIIKGPLSHVEIAQEMAEHDVFILFSNYENYPCVLIEAQASGMQIIASDVGGVKEILGDADILIEPNNEGQLKEAMKTLFVSNTNQQESTRALAKSKYAVNVIGEKIEDVYNQLLKDN